MEINLKHTDTFGTGKFVLYEEKKTFEIFQNSKTIYLTQDGNERLKKEIIKLIEESTEVIKLCSFIITDINVYHTLLNKARNTNVAIFIITQLDQKKLTNVSVLADYLPEEDLQGNPGKRHLKFIRELFDAGIHIRAAESIHAKFIITDRKNGFITSANITKPSLTFNTESGVYLDENNSVELDELFDVIFKKGTTYRQFLASVKKNKIFVVQSDTKVEQKFLPDSKKSGIRYTYENIENNLYKEIIDIVNDATEYIYLSTYSIVKLSELTEFTSSIKEAIKRGVNIFVFCRGMNYRNDHLEGTEVLKSYGCRIYADLFNHSKGIINQNSGLIFTANIDGNHGLKNGFEVGCLLTEKQRQEFLAFHKYLIETAYYHYASKPTRLDVFQSYIKYEIEKEMTPPTFPRDLVITIKNGVKLNEIEIKNELIFYGKKAKEEFLVCGKGVYKCLVKDGVFEIIAQEEPRYDLEKYVLKYFNLKIIVN